MILEILHSDKNLLRIALSGKLDATNVAHGSAEFFAMLNQRKRPVFLDFSEVTFLSSLGIRMLLTASKEVKQMGHVLKIENCSPDIEKIFHTAGLGDLLK